MHTVPVKPLSVNAAWQGRRYKTPAYKVYQFQVWPHLPDGLEIPPDCPLEINLEFGFSSKHADFDNPVKLFVDILQKRYNFDDRRIKRATIDVEHVPKGAEYIKFQIIPR